MEQQWPEELEALFGDAAPRGVPEKEDLGAFLRLLRQRRRASLASVAGQAQIARSTLNRWELGTHRPYLPELEAVLRVLGASPREREQALALAGTPRASARLREEANERAGAVGGAWLYAAGSGNGELLRALRLRRGLSQEQVTARLGIPRQTLSRWETSQTGLPVERAEELFGILGARREEVEALTSGKLTLPGLIASEGGASVEGLNALLFEMMHSPRGYVPAEEAVRDLAYLALEARITPLALKQAPARALLVDTYACHAHWLLNNDRFREASGYAERAAELARQEQLNSKGWLRAVIVSTRSCVFKGKRAHLAQGVQRFNSLLPTAINPSFESWILRELAEYLSLLDMAEPARKLSAYAYTKAERRGEPLETRLRQLDHVQILLRLGRGSEALAVLPADDTFSSKRPQHLMREHLLRSQALLLTGDAAEAHSSLGRAYAIAESSGLDTRQADVLARRF